MRGLIAVLVLVLSGCAGAPVAPASPSPTIDRGALLDEVTDRVADVAAAQATADPMLADVVAAVRRMDGAVARLRDPATVDDARDRWPPVEAAVDEVDLAPLRPAIRDIAFAVDRARESLAAARIGSTADWEARYLDAQDDTLVAMRGYAEAADALTQVLERHWPTYRAIADLTGPFLERRWVYRSDEEAANAYEVEIARHLDDLARAQAEIGRFRDERDAAARAVNDASRHAAEVFRDRPADPTVDPTAGGAGTASGAG